MQIKDYLERTSVRDFKKRKLSSKEVKVITQIINNAPTSTNAQQFSAIIVQDQKDKDWIAKNNWNQQHISDSTAFIIFLADWSRMCFTLKNKSYASEKLALHEYYRGMVDATIAATYTHNALITLGFGTTFVGGIITFAEKIHQRFNLSPNVQVVVGLSFGQIDRKNKVKPKMNKVFMDKYSKEQSLNELKKYDKIMKTYYRKRDQNQDFIEYQKKFLEVYPRTIEGFENGGNYIKKQIKNFCTKK